MRILTLTTLLFLLTGCATMFASDSMSIEFITEPAGQTVRVDGSAHTTPVKVSLATDTEHVVMWPDGSTSDIEQTMNGWVLANLIFFPGGTIIGVGIDLISGAHKKNLTPTSLTWRTGHGIVEPVKKNDPDLAG